MALQESFARPAWSTMILPALVPLEFLAVARREKMSSLINACDGQIPHVWDIGSRSGKNARRELRVFSGDVDAMLSGKPMPTLTHAECLKAFLPSTRGLKGTELQIHFTCGPDLIHDLEAAGALAVERDRLAPTGPRASKLYTLASIVSFLELRFLGIPSQN